MRDSDAPPLTVPPDDVRPPSDEQIERWATAYLRQRFPASPAIEATAVVPIPGGRSKKTFFISIAGTHELPADRFEEAFAIVDGGECGKVVLDWA